MSTATLGITSHSISSYYSELLKNNTSSEEIKLRNTYTYLIPIQMRDCKIGEIYIKSLNM